MRYAKLVLFASAAVLGPLATSGCNNGEAASSAATPPAATIGPENLAIAEHAELLSGPTISGALTPDREAQVRAEVAGTVLETRVEQGQAVTRGAVLARLEDTAIRDAWQSAQSAVRTAESSLELARRNLERSRSLSAAGAIAEREVETATWNVTNAEATLADARARYATAERQYQRTVIRAPISGIVSERAVSAGDVVQVGAQLVTIIDPSSMRLEATVPVAQLAAIQTGAPVVFTVAGYGDQRFTGKVDRVNPAVDPGTGQVRIYIRIPNTRRALVAGTFAEGQLAAESHEGVVVPIGAVDERGLRPQVVKLAQARVERVEVTLGIRDQASERIEILSGVAEGDTVLLAAAQGLAPGTVVRVAADQPRPDTTARP